jgi:hypothetical protein
MWRTIWPNLRGAVGDFWHGVRNVIRWTPVIWDDYDCDWEPLARVMVYKLRRMEPVMRNGHLENGERHAREIAICRTLLERVVADDYLVDAMRWADLPSPLGRELTEDEGRRFRAATKKADEQVKNDLDLFGRLWARHLRSWWD